MTEENCEDVEVIGWLYQFYISEKKDAVFEGLKKNKKVTPENIPAATQLFTPHWIVRYLVENSLGRLWMLNRPKSGLAAKMEYYIQTEQPETDFLRVNSPEEIKICDPACGSGHMLTYAFDLLYAIYEEEGYAPSEIPEKILTHNLYGVEIDERAGALAAFALSMKARAKQRGFFRKPVQPRICVLQNVKFEGGELARYMDFIGHDLFTAPLVTALHQFEEADNFGSLIRPEITDAAGMRKILEKKDVGRNMLLQPTHEKVLQVLEQSEYLSPRYHVVIANPPYKKKADLNEELQDWLESNFGDGKYDLYQAFILRNTKLALCAAYVAMITMQGWMFSPRYEALRANILSHNNIILMAQLGERAFDTIRGEVVSTTAFVLRNNFNSELPGQFIRLNEGKNEEEKNCSLLNLIKKSDSDSIFTAYHSDFLTISGCPIVFWASNNIRLSFRTNKPISEYIITREGLTTGNNDIFLRAWHEISQNAVGYNIIDDISAQKSNKKWFPYVKGGGCRRWYGNFEYFVNWINDGIELKAFKDEKSGRIRSHNYNGIYAFKAGFTWSGISSNDFAVRNVPIGFMFDAKGPMGFVRDSVQIELIESFLNSKVASMILQMLAPTLDFKLTHVLALPLKVINSDALLKRTRTSIYFTKSDWDSYETSWDFTTLPLLPPEYRRDTLAATYAALRAHWRDMTMEMQRLEEENNRIFIEAYGLQDELTPDVLLKEITLTCNPHYRYGGDKTEEELEALLLADTMKEFISYAEGCMFGRYALEKPGLVLANQGETYADYLKQVPAPLFPADKDNVIPILDGDWFTDDMTGRFREFLRITLGEEHYVENLAFIEKAIGKDIRKYFIKDFYNDHVKRYKKRPIYWLFSSPRGSFNALIYMHRYTPDTVSIVLNDYLREFQTKLAAEKSLQETIEASASSSPTEKAKATKNLDTIRKTIKELEDYERDTLYPLATRRIEIDLDDGVKVNYPKFGAALKKIPGLEAKEE